MSDLMLLSQAQMRRIKPYFPLSRGIPRVDDRKIISGIIFVLRTNPCAKFRARRSLAQVLVDCSDDANGAMGCYDLTVIG